MRCDCNKVILHRSGFHSDVGTRQCFSRSMATHALDKVDNGATLTDLFSFRCRRVRSFRLIELYSISGDNIIRTWHTTVFLIISSENRNRFKCFRSDVAGFDRFDYIPFLVIIFENNSWITVTFIR